MSTSIIHVIDDDEDMRTGVARLLRAEGYEVRTYASAGEFLVAPPEQTPGCVVLDLQMPGPSGLELQQALQRHPTPLPIVFVTGRGDVTASVRAMKAGAVDFLTKPVESAVLLQAIETALIRDQAERRDREKTSNAQARYARLTQRERSVFDQVVAGRLNKQIADQLGISERTVKMHRAQVMAKMEARSPAELFQMADVLHQARRPAETPAPRD